MTADNNEINSQFSSPPYQQMALRTGKVHVVMTTRDVFGDTPFSNGLFYATQKFHDANPKIYRVVLESLSEAIDLINADKRKAAAQYLEITKENMTVDQVVEAISQPLVEYSLVPHNVFAVASFMHRVGSLKGAPESWQDLFFPDVHHLPGS